jgi:hypothetical protein
VTGDDVEDVIARNPPIIKLIDSKVKLTAPAIYALEGSLIQL